MLDGVLVSESEGGSEGEGCSEGCSEGESEGGSDSKGEGEGEDEGEGEGADEGAGEGGANKEEQEAPQSPITAAEAMRYVGLGGDILTSWIDEASARGETAEVYLAYARKATGRSRRTEGRAGQGATDRRACIFRVRQAALTWSRAHEGKGTRCGLTYS
ncbi:hypothetical protein T492DRAFT_1121128 [Pavlovales sp. CCMP2436]|nr:hypothetical protein T492DRAFT_1121128 [Pavlovales sp. CCMP2436]